VKIDRPLKTLRCKAGFLYAIRECLDKLFQMA